MTRERWSKNSSVRNAIAKAGLLMGIITDKHPKVKWIMDIIFIILFLVLIYSSQSMYNVGLINGIYYCKSRCGLCSTNFSEIIFPNISSSITTYIP